MPRVANCRRETVASNDHPCAPDITYGELLTQFKADVYGKEVQSAATYSYMWMADQMGHVCVGILVNLITTFGAGYLGRLFGWQNHAAAIGLFAAIAIVAAWEASTYISSERSTTGLFPLFQQPRRRRRGSSSTKPRASRRSSPLTSHRPHDLGQVDEGGKR
jgi:hypothetical protein